MSLTVRSRKTKHAAELCALLVNDLYGELPSRILAALLTKGRSTAAQLVIHTSLGIRQIRHALGVLVQQNLLFHRTDPDSRITSYEANTNACYNLLRFGRILEVVESQYGSLERELVQTLMGLGHAKVHDLSQAFESRNTDTSGGLNGTHDASSGRIESEAQLSLVLARLIQAEIVETVRPDSFRNPSDVLHEIERDVMATGPGEKSTKNKAEHQRQIMERYRQFCDQKTILKRQLDAGRGPVKRRKLENGHSHHDPFDEEDVPRLNPNVVVRINHEKCLVELRNEHLANFAADAFGATTGEVYRALLSLVTNKISKCQPDKVLDEDAQEQNFQVTTLDVFEHLGDSVNVQGGIGKAPMDTIDSGSAEKVRVTAQESDDESDASESGPPVRRSVSVAINGAKDEFEDSDNDEEMGEAEHEHSMSGTNGTRPPRVTFQDESTSRDSRLSRLRQHLLLLAESKYRFIRHCGIQGQGQWTVDFRPLMSRLQELELDAFVEQTYGRHGLRLTRILRERGKLDEKLLPSAALMKKNEVQGTMLAMQMAGLVDVQEVPKDNTRTANRTLFFWFFDKQRTQSQLLDNIYKATLRCLQTLDVKRYHQRNILSFVERKDVMGKEEEVMTAEHYNQYNRHLEVQAKLLGQVMRLDNMVAVLRDF
ncbi:hypothetical protein S40285_02192 [Stachybotrys chlorohalonatus IBT 40285]|uniref:DNA-directed RNA polymerase III subunit RPC3 n=1 Tax=Stachybotrys chlorohalonatus (strain IBT 40285) TaxID=1283841 RepID=A0A084QAZ1_STAC4|nr:hypothetical protein S40285_02192 [Stachybotrys chlorohalonata IBT 40285]